MEIVDARRLAGEHTDLLCDICCVGAGAAGLFISTELARWGLSVILLEAGGRVCASAAEIGMDVLGADSEYRGASEGRYFGLGGSTSRWGGLLIPHSSADVREVGDRFDPWRHIIQVVRDEHSHVARALGLSAQKDPAEAARQLLPDAAANLERSGIRVLATEFLPLRKKNLSSLLRDPSLRRRPLRILLGAVACLWERGTCQRIRAVTAVAGTRHIRVRAKGFVVAAGAIESARILLELDRQIGPGALLGTESVGRCLSDHLSCPIAEAVGAEARLAVHRFAPRFKSGRMRSFRFLESLPKPDAPRAFAHFIFLNDNPGFLLAKKVLGELQAGKFPSLRPSEVTAGAAGVLQLAWHRFVSRRLYIHGEKARVQFQLDMEQLPHAGNRITLSHETDRYGRQKARVEWSIRQEDLEALRRAARRFLSAWPGRRIGLPELTAVPLDAYDFLKPHDAYHPVGTCRLGVDEDAVVTPELRVRGIDNVFVLSTAVFPTAGSANPTFSMLCLGSALAKQLRTWVASQNVEF